MQQCQHAVQAVEDVSTFFFNIQKCVCVGGAAFTQGVETRHRYQKISKNEAVKRTCDRASSSPAVFLLLLGCSRLILTRAARTDTYSTAHVGTHSI